LAAFQITVCTSTRHSKRLLSIFLVCIAFSTQECCGRFAEPVLGQLQAIPSTVGDTLVLQFLPPSRKLMRNTIAFAKASELLYCLNVAIIFRPRSGWAKSSPTFITRRRPPTLVESGDWFGSSLLGRRLDKCFATALGNHVKSRMPTPLDVLSAHQIRNFGTSTGSQRPHSSSVLARSGQFFQ
jgi:hypothetical protein